MELLPLRTDDLGELLTVQPAAYVTEAQLYADPHLPPLVQTLDDLHSKFGEVDGIVLRTSGRLVGSVRFRTDGDLLHIGRLAVVPDQQGRGLGTRLLAAAEAATPAARATLFTGHLSAANLRLYEWCGYVEERREVVRPGLTLVHLGKTCVRRDQV